MKLNVRKRPRQYIVHLLKSANDGPLFPKLNSNLKIEEYDAGTKIPAIKRMVKEILGLHRNFGTLYYSCLDKKHEPSVFYPKWRHTYTDTIMVTIAEQWYNPAVCNPGDCIFFECIFIRSPFYTTNNNSAYGYDGHMTIRLKDSEAQDNPSIIEANFRRKFVEDIINGKKTITDCTVKDISYYTIKYGYYEELISSTGKSLSMAGVNILYDLHKQAKDNDSFKLMMLGF